MRSLITLLLLLGYAIVYIALMSIAVYFLCSELLGKALATAGLWYYWNRCWDFWSDWFEGALEKKEGGRNE